MYWIVQTAKLNELTTETYLRNTLAKIAEGYPSTPTGSQMMSVSD